MEAWNGQNFYTSNSTQWVILMNLTTAEWGIGPFVPNLKALSGPLSENVTFPPGTLVIEYAGQTMIGTRPIEAVIFGIVSGIVLLCTFVWLFLNRAILKSFLKLIFKRREPHQGPNINASNVHPLNGHASEITLTQLDLGENFVSAAEFERQLREFYYDQIESELEGYEKGTSEEISAEDIEGVTALVRMMYGVDLGLYSHERTHGFGEQEREEYRTKSDAILAEIREKVRQWDQRERASVWNPQELGELRAIVHILTERLPERRYAHIESGT